MIWNNFERKFCKKMCKKIEFYFQSNSVMNSLKCPKSKSLSHCLNELFPIYQDKYWTIRQQDDRSVDPSYYIEDCRIFKFKSWLDSNAHKSQDADVRSSDMKRFLSMCTWPTNAMAQKWNIFIESIYRRKMHSNHLRSSIWMNYFFRPRTWSKEIIEFCE